MKYMEVLPDNEWYALREMDTIVNPVCALCRDYEQAGVVHGVQVGMLLSKELA